MSTVFRHRTESESLTYEKFTRNMSEMFRSNIFPQQTILLQTKYDLSISRSECVTSNLCVCLFPFYNFVQPLAITFNKRYMSKTEAAVRLLASCQGRFFGIMDGNL